MESGVSVCVFWCPAYLPLHDVCRRVGACSEAKGGVISFTHFIVFIYPLCMTCGYLHCLHGKGFFVVFSRDELLLR